MFVYSIAISCMLILDILGSYISMVSNIQAASANFRRMLFFWSWKEDTGQVYSEAAVWQWRFEGEKTCMILSFTLDDTDEHHGESIARD
jgi:hypothetical protein